MSSITQFQVAFDNPDGIYYSGQTLAGHILLSVATALDIRGVVIRITGSTEVKWNETHNRKHHNGRKTHRRTETIVYYSNEIYFADKYYLVGGPEARIILAPGQHVYAFQKLLGSNLPSNFEGTHGSVRYSVEASVDRPGAIDHKCLAAFNVISPIDLRMHPTAPFPIERVIEKKFSYIWRSAGNMSMTVRLPYGGYVSGQVIPITLIVENDSEVEVTGITCRMRRTTHFQAMNPHHKTKTEKTAIGVIRFGTVAPKRSKTETRTLDVPVMPAYNLMPCSVIDMNYDMKFDVAVEAFHRDVTLTIPLVIGTVPLEGTMASSVPVYANSDGVPVGTVRGGTVRELPWGGGTVGGGTARGYTPGGASNDHYGDHARLMARSGSTGAIMPGSAQNIFPDNNARHTGPYSGQEMNDQPPPYHVAVEGLPMASKSAG